MVTADPAAFIAELPTAGRLLGLDLGSKTIGTALCDAQWTFATAAKTLVRGKFAEDKATLTELVSRETIRGIVVGLPLNLDGSDSPRTQSTRAFARNLAVIDLPILLWDERLSTAAVERAMIAADISRAKRATRIDAAAAAYILQGAIDRLVNL